MTAWLNEYLTSWVYLTAAAMATLLLVMLWFARTRMSMSMSVCASVALAMWTGLSLRSDWEVDEPRTLLLTVSVLASCLLVLTLWPVLLKSTRTSRQLKHARACVGKKGKVYHAIESDTPGSVQVILNNKPICLPATCETGSRLPAFCEVTITQANDAGQLIVTPIT